MYWKIHIFRDLCIFQTLGKNILKQSKLFLFSIFGSKNCELITKLKSCSEDNRRSLSGREKNHEKQPDWKKMKPAQIFSGTRRRLHLDRRILTKGRRRWCRLSVDHGYWLIPESRWLLERTYATDCRRHTLLSSAVLLLLPLRTVSLMWLAFAKVSTTTTSHVRLRPLPANRGSSRRDVLHRLWTLALILPAHWHI